VALRDRMIPYFASPSNSEKPQLPCPGLALTTSYRSRRYAQQGEDASRRFACRPAPKGATDFEGRTVSLKRYPDTNPQSDALVRIRKAIP
jgi:hypothetical protein